MLADKAGEAAVGEAAALRAAPSVAGARAARGSTGDAPAGVDRATGTGSASEAAALAVAGPGARLVGPRLMLRRVTCAWRWPDDLFISSARGRVRPTLITLRGRDFLARCPVCL